MSNKRLSFANFPIPFDHPYILPTLVTTMTVSALAYYTLQASHHSDMIEALRKQSMRKRRHLHRPEDRYASLQIETRFVNPFDSWRTPSWNDYLLYWIKHSWKRLTTRYPEPKELDSLLPMNKPEFDQIFSSISSHSPPSLTESWVQIDKESSPACSKTTFTWLGQSTCLVTLDGLTILTDPVFDDSLMSKKHTRSFPWKLQEFQSNVHIVLISHDHADHLDEHVVNILGNSVTWYVPLGLRDWFVHHGVENVIELDWWQEVRHKERPEVIIASVPSMHSSGRWSMNKNKSLWSNFVIKSKDESFFFCGASGYDKDLFKAIGNVYAPLTLAALPIGGFTPRTMKKALHMDPSEAVKAHHHLGCPTLSIGIHWGTFIPSMDESYLEPQRILQQTLEKHPLPSTLSAISPPSATVYTTTENESIPTSSLTSNTNKSEHIGNNARRTLFTTTSLGKTVFVDNLDENGYNLS
ncbi:beta-lactamase superfamily domain-containing protein [Halteromyces radiatus]|uniref:beta-lactamase superfamily domain-containing protein n=1 Tax=Halteromyces radiatus TaxID=101107 RepID=UPI002220C2A7|nr:beta-lactamase superfamily domain-containing protein [Halteromyces radiatus]KAI8099772.1 beta-lactamase superfamily domain-containing protein [Halteromyces radiatus]